MARAADLPPPLAFGAFSVHYALALGVGAGRLRRADLVAPFHGVRSHQPPLSLFDRVAAYASRMPDHHHFSHDTAAQLAGLRMPQGFAGEALHVSVLAPARAPRVEGVVGHQARADTPRFTTASGWRMTSPVTTWLDLAAGYSVHDVIVMGDGLLRRKHPLATIGQLQEAVESRAGQRGSRVLNSALPHLRAGTDSARETMLRLVVVDAGLPEPVVNLAIVNRFGAIVAHGDLGYPHYRLLLEYDGGQHRTDDRQFGIDIRRLDDLMEERWRVIRVDKELLANRPVLLAKIRRALIAGGWAP